MKLLKSTFPFFILIILLLISFTSQARGIDNPIVIIDNTGLKTCTRDSCLIDSQYIHMLNNYGVVRISYFDKDNITDIKTEGVYYNEYIKLKVYDNHVLLIKDLENENVIIFETVVYKSNFDNFVNYGGGKFFNSYVIMPIPAFIFSILIAYTKLRYHKKDLLGRRR